MADKIRKMNRSEFVTYLDTTPEASSMNFAILGVGVTDMAISYNPSVESEKWIIEDTARHIHESNEKQSSVSQSIYVGDPCYEFVEKGLDKLNYKTHILNVNRAKELSEGEYYADLSDGLISITSYMGENATIEYDLYFEGTKKVGSVQFDESGKPTFTEESSVQ